MSIHDEFEIHHIKFWGGLAVGAFWVTGFGLTLSSTPEVNAAITSTTTQVTTSLKHLFRGGQNSVVAKTVGAAEGTRTTSGGFTSAYSGHSDPGNGVWNLGSFSYQHGASSPEEADRKQLRRLEGQAQVLVTQAQQHGVKLGEVELLNGIDLANQAPQAALDRGYIPRLRECRSQGKKGSDAVLCARSTAFVDPTTGKLQAPGLGNTMPRVEADQERRMDAIAAALKTIRDGR